ncbi:MAG: hypothetical protein ACLFV0_07405, partial [Nitriliruptoraceae bacterium]
MIGLVMPWNIPELLDTVELTTSEKNYRTMLHSTVGRDEEAEAKALHAVIDRGVDGIIWLPVNPTKAYTEVKERIRDHGIRVVYLERPLLERPDTHDAVK